MDTRPFVYKPQRYIRSDFIGVVNVPDDFSISFNILPYETSKNWCSVVHFKGAEQDMPSVWFSPTLLNCISFIPVLAVICF
jgi:hypothetical protein